MMLSPVISGDFEARVINLERYAMLWRGQWVSQTYPKNSVVNDGGWLMIANKETSAQAAPQDVGLPSSELPDTPAWSESSYSGLVLSGHEYTLTKPGYFKRIDVWAPEVTAQTNYRILVIDYQDPANPKIISIANPVLTADAWTPVAVGKTPFPVGAVVGVFIEAYSASGAAPVSGQWARQSNSNNGAPSSGSWLTRDALDVVRINKTDGNSIDRAAELLSVGAGATLIFTESGNSGAYYTFLATGPASDQGDYFEWPVNLTETGTAGAPAIGVTSDIAISIPTFVSTKYEQISGYWPANQPDFATVVGKLSFDGTPQTANNGAFGVRVEFQEASLSPDWDFMALSE